MLPSVDGAAADGGSSAAMMGSMVHGPRPTVSFHLEIVGHWRERRSMCGRSGLRVLSQHPSAVRCAGLLVLIEERRHFDG
jgi:hypothetical protein